MAVLTPMASASEPTATKLSSGLARIARAPSRTSGSQAAPQLPMPTLFPNPAPAASAAALRGPASFLFAEAFRTAAANQLARVHLGASAGSRPRGEPRRRQARCDSCHRRGPQVRYNRFAVNASQQEYIPIGPSRAGPVALGSGGADARG